MGTGEKKGRDSSENELEDRHNERGGGMRHCWPPEMSGEAGTQYLAHQGVRLAKES